MMLLATVAIDQIEWKDRQEFWTALNELCSPETTCGFSSSGIYSFWDPVKFDLLYVGLASDLSLRIGQHLGLIQCDPKCCKSKQVEKFVFENGRIGIGLLLMSPNDQTILASRKTRVTDNERLAEIEMALGREAKDMIAHFESLVLRSHKHIAGKLPQWNRNAGSKLGQAHSDVSLGGLVQALSGRFDVAHTSRLSIREFNDLPESQIEEFVLHPARMTYSQSNGTFEDHVRGWVKLQGKKCICAELLDLADQKNYFARQPFEVNHIHGELPR
jgi:hypothetical protein